MFKTLYENDFNKNYLQGKALPTIIENRKQNKDIYDFIYEYIKEHSLFVSNIDLVLHKIDNNLPCNKYENNIIIYSSNPERVGKEMASKLCSKFGQYFLFRDAYKGIEFYIEYNVNRICYIYNLNMYKDMKLDDIFVLTKYDSIIYLPKFLELIELYRILYNPEYSKEWDDVLHNINLIHPLIYKEIKTIKNLNKFKIGNSPKKLELKKLNSANITKCRELRRDKITEIKQIVLEYLANSSAEYMFLDILAYNIQTYTENNKKNIDIHSTPIEIISQNSIENDIEHLSIFLSKYTEYSINYKEKELYLPNDILIRKYTVSLLVPNKKNDCTQHPILNIYNNSSYELIPYEVHTVNDVKYKIADPIVQIRICLINIWVIMIANNVHKLNEKEVLIYITNRLLLIDYFHSLINIYNKKEYIGTYIYLNTYKKINSLKIMKKLNFYCYDF